MLWHPLAYSGILWHTLACSGILWHNQCIIITADGAYHCPVGSIWPFLSTRSAILDDFGCSTHDHTFTPIIFAHVSLTDHSPSSSDVLFYCSNPTLCPNFDQETTMSEIQWLPHNLFWVYICIKKHFETFLLDFPNCFKNIIIEYTEISGVV